MAEYPNFGPRGKDRRDMMTFKPNEDDLDSHDKTARDMMQERAQGSRRSTLIHESFPPAGEAQPAHMGSQSETPSKE